MNKYLKASSESFDKIKRKDYLLSPISYVDCEIMVEIMELFKKVDLTDVVEVLRNYKFHKDEEIRDQLLDCNTNFINKSQPKDVDLKDKSKQQLLNTIKELEDLLKNKRKFVEINKDKLLANLIFGFLTEEEYDVKDNFTGKIILNPVDKLATKIPLYANYEIKYYDEEEFEEAVDSFKNQLKECDIKFVNEIIAEKEKQDKNDSGVSSGESDTDSTD